jgi:enoyl-CoA hydratase
VDVARRLSVAAGENGAMPDDTPAEIASSPDHPPVLSIAGPVATLRLMRPARRNRLGDDDLDTLQAALARVASDRSVRVLVLASTGPVFCAGYDLAALDGARGDGPRRFEAAVLAMQALPQPTVCRLQGSVHGGATDLALACDFRIGTPAVVLRMPAARIGLHYYASGLARFAAKLGVGAAKRLFLAAPTVDAAELLRIGYLDACVEPGQLDDTVDRWCVDLAAGAPLAVQGMKRALDDWATGHLDTEAVTLRTQQCADSDDLREGLAAVRERREPRFSGR